MFETVCCARGGGNKVSKVGMEGIIIEGDENIRAKAGSWATLRVIFE
jgi:hypothetical protein